MQKGGTAPIMDVIGYGDPVVTKGLKTPYGPGRFGLRHRYDGSRRTSIRSPPAVHLVLRSGPTLKISTNTPLAEKKGGWIDFNTGVIADGEKTIDEAAKDLLDLVIRVASGEQTKAEKHGFRRDLHLQGRRGSVTEKGLLYGKKRYGGLFVHENGKEVFYDANGAVLF